MTSSVPEQERKLLGCTLGCCTRCFLANAKGAFSRRFLLTDLLPRLNLPSSSPKNLTAPHSPPHQTPTTFRPPANQAHPPTPSFSTTRSPTSRFPLPYTSPPSAPHLTAQHFTLSSPTPPSPEIAPLITKSELKISNFAVLSLNSRSTPLESQCAFPRKM
jgi:hypothetical protein